MCIRDSINCMDKRSPDDIRKSIKSLVEEAENVSIDDVKSESNNDNAEISKKSKLEAPPNNLEDKYKPENTGKVESIEKDLNLTGLISDDVALAVRAVLMRYSDVVYSLYLRPFRLIRASAL